MKRYLILLFLLIPSLCFAATVQNNTASYGGIIFSNDDAGFVGTIEAAVAGTYYGFINGSSESLNGMTFVDDDVNGDYLLVGTDGAGIYHTYGAASFGEALPAGETVHCAVFVNSTETKVEFQRALSAGADVGAGPMAPDFLTLAAGDQVRIKCKTDGTSKTVQIYHMGVTLYRVFTVHTQINQTGTPCHGCL